MSISSATTTLRVGSDSESFLVRKAAIFFGIITTNCLSGKASGQGLSPSLTSGDANTINKGKTMKMSILAASAAALVLAGCSTSPVFNPDVNSAVSPDGKNEIRLYSSPLAYEVMRDGVVVVAKTEIGLKMNVGKLISRKASISKFLRTTLAPCSDALAYSYNALYVFKKQDI